MTELQQSSLYSLYIQKLGWTVADCEGTRIFIKHIPFLGTIAKLQRCEVLPSIQTLERVIKQYQINRLTIEPAANVSQKAFSQYLEKLHLSKTPFLPTKTILIDLTSSEEEIFNHFSEAKRRAVRRAINHHVLIKESSDIHEFIKIKNKSAGLFGFITTYGIKQLWEIFAPDNSAILLAYSGPVIAGVLLLFVGKRAYYWLAGATRHGKKLFAPTLLIWEALRFSKKHGCTEFDFVGVWDERLPNLNKEWKGFTKFKEGFGGTPCYYPTVL